MTHPRLWVRVVEAHATRTWVALILACSAGISVITLVAAGVLNVVLNPDVHDLSSNFTAAISSTLGVLVGALATYVGSPPQAQSSETPPRDDELVLDVEHPKTDEGEL